MDAPLQEIHAYLTALAAEIDAAESPTNQQGYTYQVTITVTGWLAQLRHALQTDQEQQRAVAEMPWWLSDSQRDESATSTTEA